MCFFFFPSQQCRGDAGAPAAWPASCCKQHVCAEHKREEDGSTVSAASLMPAFESDFFLSMLPIVEVVAGLAAQGPDQLSSGSLSDTSG